VDSTPSHHSARSPQGVGAIAGSAAPHPITQQLDLADRQISRSETLDTQELLLPLLSSLAKDDQRGQAMVLARLAQCAAIEGQPFKSIDYLERAVAALSGSRHLDPERAGYENGLARRFAEVGLWAEACRHWQEALGALRHTDSQSGYQYLHAAVGLGRSAVFCDDTGAPGWESIAQCFDSKQHRLAACSSLTRADRLRWGLYAEGVSALLTYGSDSTRATLLDDHELVVRKLQPFYLAAEREAEVRPALFFEVCAVFGRMLWRLDEQPLCQHVLDALPLIESLPVGGIAARDTLVWFAEASEVRGMSALRGAMFDDAAVAFKAAEEGFRRAFGDRHPRLLPALYHRAVLAMDDELHVPGIPPQETRDGFDQILRILEATPGYLEGERQRWRHSLASAYLQHGYPTAAATVCPGYVQM